MEKIKWMDKKTNAEVIHLANETPMLITNIKGRKKDILATWLRTVFERRLEEKCPRERKRIMMLYDINDGKTYFLYFFYKKYGNK